MSSSVQGEVLKNFKLQFLSVALAGLLFLLGLTYLVNLWVEAHR